MTDDAHFDLPSKPTALAHFTAFYDKVTFNKDGTATLTMKVPAENKARMLALSENDGKALNVSVWETALPPEFADLQRAAGLDL